MAPTPSAGRKGSAEPETPTKSGKKPESSSTQKLTGTASARKPPKLGAAKTPKQTPKAKDVEDKGKEAQGKIDMKDNDAAEETTGKISQAGDQSATSVADTSELSEADPNPVPDSDEDETVAGARDTVDKAAKDEGKFTSPPFLE
jgi:hypothetical protein